MRKVYLVFANIAAGRVELKVAYEQALENGLIYQSIAADPHLSLYYESTSKDGCLKYIEQNFKDFYFEDLTGVIHGEEYLNK